MAKEKSPAFQFYPKDFLTDERVRLMSHQERGIYITLLCMCWQEGSLPASVDDLARLVGMPLRQFKRLWAGSLGQCFTADGASDGRWRNKRLDEERDKQETYRRRQSDKGKASAANRKATDVQPDGNRGSTAVQPNTQPEGNSSSPICNLQSSSVPTKQERSAPPLGDANSKRPMFVGQRLKVFEWQVSNLERMLGIYTDGFDLHEWFFALDAELLAKNEVPPARDGGEWLEARTLVEAQRRGLPLRRALVPQDAGKLTTRLAGMVERARTAERS
jgi:uncharacterized protein YdaU (DUF1376 family)